MNTKKHSLLLLILALVLCLTALPVAAEDGAPTATFTLNGSTTYATLPVTDGSVTLLKTPNTLSGFCGWQAEIDGKTVFLPAGATCTGLTGDVTFKAVTASFVTDTGCSVRLRENQVGLRFTSTLVTADFEKIVALAGGRDKVSFGTYIVPSRYVTDAQGVFTLEALAQAGRTMYIDVKAGAFYKTTETTSTLAGSVSGILKGNYTMEYTGRGYMKITYTDGSVGTVYADYNQTNNSRNILTTVLDAYNDRDESYGNLIVEKIGSTHSPYTNTEIAMMRAFLDKVILVGHDMQYNYFVLPTEYYESPWKITFSSDSFDVRTIFAEPPEGMTAEDAMGVYLDGLVIPLSKTSIQNGKLVFKRDSYIQIQ